MEDRGSYIVSDISTITHDVLIIGSGLAGLRAAISAAAVEEKLTIGVISKVQVMRSHSVSAEGGTAAVLYERSEEHTSELQSRQYLVCRLLLEKNPVLRQACRGLHRRLRPVDHEHDYRSLGYPLPVGRARSALGHGTAACAQDRALPEQRASHE